MQLKKDANSIWQVVKGCYSPSPGERVMPKARDCLLQNADGAEVKKPWCDLVYNITFKESDILIREQKDALN